MDRSTTDSAARSPARALGRFSIWDVALLVAFAIGSGASVLYPILAPGILGSHAVVYADAAAAWLTGANPWTVGPPAVVFAGPPTMLLPFAPFAFLPGEVTRVVWVVGMLLAAVWALRRLGLPGWWVGFPPVFESIVLGHPEVLVLLLLTATGWVSGLAAIVKPYAAAALLAERRWPAFAVAIAVGLATFLFLPWGRFLAEWPQISATLARQNTGDSVFGNLPLMVVAVVALASLGPRRALWLGVPLLWPNAQHNYKTIAVPALPPVVAVLWSLPIAGMTLVGIVAYSVLDRIDRRRPLPAWLRPGIQAAGPRQVIATQEAMT